MIQCLALIQGEISKRPVGGAGAVSPALGFSLPQQGTTSTSAAAEAKVSITNASLAAVERISSGTAFSQSTEVTDIEQELRTGLGLLLKHRGGIIAVIPLGIR